MMFRLIAVWTVLVGVFLVAGLAHCADQDAGRGPNKVAVISLIESLGSPEYEAIAGAILSPAYQELRSEFQNLAFHAQGSELMDAADSLQKAISNRKSTVGIVIADGDRVGVQYRIKGMHAGNLHGVPATGKSFEVDAAAIFRFADGKITEGWFMADEAGLLRQIGARFPVRSDGRAIAAPLIVEARPGDELIAELLEHPVDSQAYRNKLMVNAYKSKNPPAGILAPGGGRPYEEATRRGFHHLSLRGAELGKADEFPFGGAFPDRLDKIALLLSEGGHVMIQFRLTATNGNSLFGIPATNAPVDAWEVGFMTFEGDVWKYGWWFGDDLGMSLQLNAPADFLFPGQVDGAEAAKIRLEIQQLVDDYAIYRDNLDAKNYANLFTEDGVLIVRGNEYQGREILYQRMLDADTSRVSMHVMSSSQITIIDRNNATGVHYAAVYTGSPTDNPGQPIPVRGFAILGQYRDNYARTAEGWKISERKMQPVFATAD